MAGKKLQDRTFHIAVVGLSGDERTKGSVGVGKSCLCNRFVRPHADHFYKDHISIISQIDFSGRVINNDHFLYWGEVSKSLEDGSSVTCSIVELTEFIDDQSFQPLRGHGDKDYRKRCKSSLSSAEKLMYICKDQLGDEVNYDRKIMPDGKFVVDGFLVVFDVSHVHNRPANKQYSFILDLLSGPLSKSKKPCVLVATKCEEPEEKAMEEVRAIKDKKKVALVETSAVENVNVDFAFLTLVNQIDKNKKLQKEVPFLTGIKKQKELLDKVEDAYMSLLNRHVSDYRDIWNRTKKKLVGEDHYNTYLKYFGSEIAAKKFRSHTKKLKEDKQQWKKQQCLDTLPRALEDMLPDLKSIDGKDWTACKEIMSAHPNYTEWFVQLPRGDAWRTSEYIDQTDHRIAVDFLKTNAVDCEKCFKNHENRLKEALKKERMKTEFRKLLKALSDVVLPGRTLQDTLTHLVDEESYQYLNEAERKEIYNAHQREITEQGKSDFVEMLLENVETFEDFDMDNVNAHMEAIIKHTLQKEPRYKYLDGLNQERRLLLMKHAAFVNNPCKQTCPSQTRCMDELINQTMEQKVTKCQERELPERWSEPNSKLSIVVLGENGLADELVNEIRAQSVQEEYTLDNVIYSLELRPIDGDLARPQNYLTTQDFTPQGCICTFSSPEDLAYIESSLKTSRLAVTVESKNDIYATLQPEMPVILLHARNLSIPESDVFQMKQDTNLLADLLSDKAIIDMPTDESTLWHGKKFHESQIRHAIRTIAESRRSSTDRDDDVSHDGSQYDPDLRIGMALMCGDQNLPDLVLGPIISNDTCCRDMDLKQTVNVDMFLNTVKRRVSIEITSFHQANLYTGDVHHGYILVYSTKRRASFETLKFFVKSVTPIPVEIVAVSDSDKFSSDYEMQALIAEGNKFADETKNCTFITAGANFSNQSLAYSTFFTEAYDKIFETERMHDELFAPFANQDEDVMEEERQGIRTPVEPPPAGFEEYSKPILKGVAYKPEKKGEEALYDQPERYPPSPRRSQTNKGEDPIYGIVQKPKSKPEPAGRRRNSAQSPGSKGDGEEVLDPVVRRRSKTEVKRRSQDGDDSYEAVEEAGKVNRRSLQFRLRRSSSNRSSEADDEQGFVENVLYSPYTGPPKGAKQQGNGSAHYASTKLYDDHHADMMKNPIYDCVEPTPANRFPSGKPVPPPKPKPRQGNRPKVSNPEEINSDNEPSEPIYAVAKKKGNASSDSDSKGSVEADRDHQKKKRNSFRRKKNRSDHPPHGADDASPLHKPNLGERIYDMPGTFSPDEDEVTPKARKRQQMEEKNRKKEEKRQIAANKKRDKAQRQQQRHHKRQKTKKKPPAYAGYLDKPKGVALEELVTENDPLPKFVEKCIEFIDREGINQEGLYRVSGKSADCDALTERFEIDPNISIESMEMSVHAVASAVKQFFKHLPDPLIPHELQGELLQMFNGKSQEEFVEAMPEFFNKLPPIRLAILKFLMQHFGRVIEQSEINKMTEQNLTVCWWPTLLHPQFKSLEDVANETQLSAFVEQWVKHSVKLFGTGVEEQEAPEDDSPIYDQPELIPDNPDPEVN